MNISQAQALSKQDRKNKNNELREKQVSFSRQGQLWSGEKNKNQWIQSIRMLIITEDNE